MKIPNGSSKLRRPPAMDLIGASDRLDAFRGASVKHQIKAFEAALENNFLVNCKSIFTERSVNLELLKAALVVKKASSQIDNLVHAIGMLLLLPKILNNTNERILRISLSAGTGGKKVDLETTRRMAEFKFMNWQRGSNAVRHHSVFKDFVGLAELDTTKRKELYLIDPDHSLRWMAGKVKVQNALGAKLLSTIESRYPDQVKTVGDYYRIDQRRRNCVNFVDMRGLIPLFIELPPAETEHELG